MRAYMAADWQEEQQNACRRLGLPASPPFQPPAEYLLMGIGQRGDHIFQGIIYGQPKHPLLLAAIKHAFSRRILACIANREYMVFCKELWKLLQQDLGRDPQALPQAVSEAQDVKALAHTIDMPPREQPGALPKLGEVGENVVQSIDDNSFDAIMDVIGKEVKYQGPIEVTELLGYEAGPSIQSKDAEIPKREQIVRECQSDSFFDWLHALATILIFHEPLILSGLRSTELTTLWNRRIATLSKVPWIFGPLLLVRNVSHRTSWMEAMSARLADNDHGRLTVALAAPDGSQSHATITAFFGILGGLFRSMWDRTEMSALLETDDNFEIVASTAKSIYADESNEACGSITEQGTLTPRRII
ncbi:unnamed protein product [Symbiodinium sp. CCMP2456]|nr:unnamed protein product [Symbiodinium sp. CCMP2456]